MCIRDSFWDKANELAAKRGLPPYDLAVAWGQPWRLRAADRLLCSAGDPEGGFLPTTENGVNMGVDSPLPRAHRIFAKSSGGVYPRPRRLQPPQTIITCPGTALRTS